MKYKHRLDVVVEVRYKVEAENDKALRDALDVLEKEAIEKFYMFSDGCHWGFVRQKKCRVVSRSPSAKEKT